MLAATAIVGHAGETWALQCLWLGVGFAAILGHMFSCFLRFTGGKGVATSAGVLLGLWPYLTLPGLLGIITWLIVFLPWRYVSLASIIGAVALPIYFIVLGLLLGWGPFSEHMPLLLFVILVAALVVVRHRSNIARLRAGTEHRFSSKRS
jgi:glycerol-3-phosphate acyltransferase PlsY